MTPKTVAIFHAEPTPQDHLIEALRAHQRAPDEVRGLSLDTRASQARFDTQRTLKLGSDWVDALKGASALWLTPPDAPPGESLVILAELVHAAVQASVGRIILHSSTLAGLRSPALDGELLRRAEMLLSQTELPWRSLRAGVSSEVLRMFTLDPSEKTLSTPVNQGAGAFLNPADLAALGAELLTTRSLPEAQDNLIEVTGPEALTLEEVASRWSDVLGFKLLHAPVSARAFIEGQTAAGRSRWQVERLQSHLLALRQGRLAEVQTDAFESIMGHPPGKLDAWLRPRL